MTIINSLNYAWKSRRTWLYTAHAKNQARFSRTIIGGYWFGLSNLLTILLLAVFYVKIFKVENVWDYVVYMGLGKVLWQTSTHAINGADTILTGNKPKIISTNINPIFFALETWIFELHNFYQSFLMVIFCLFFVKKNILLEMIIYGPFSLINFLISMFWIPLIISLIIARFQDIKQIIPVIIHFLFLTSPILYYEKQLGPLKYIVRFNPVYNYIRLVRDSIIENSFLLNENIILLIINIFGILLSIKLLNKSRKNLPFYI